jgi:hypothetical protein
MSAAVLREWFQRRGLRTYQSPSSSWCEAGPGVLQAIPYHAVVRPDRDELRALFGQSRAIAVRYSAPIDAPRGKPSYHVIGRPESVVEEALGKKARYDVRRGLARATVEPIALSRLAAEGWQLRLDTLRRQNRVREESEAWWQKLCTAAEGLPGFEAWGAIAKDGSLAASLLAFSAADSWSILYQQSLTLHLGDGVNAALALACSRSAFGRYPGVTVFYGLESLTAPASVDEFKFRIGFERAAVRQVVVFHPLAGPLVNRASYAVLRWLAQLAPHSALLPRAAGLCRFHIEGRR